MRVTARSFFQLLLPIAVVGGTLSSLCPPIHAAREITISRESRFPIGLVPLGGSTGGSATGIVSRDLEKSGFFRFAPPGRGVFVATGTSSGGKIEGRLVAPDGREIFSRTYAGTGLKANAHRFADDIVFAATGKPGISSGSICFVSTKSGNKEIYLCDSDGGNVRKVTSDRSLCVSPSISADGSFLVHTGYKSGYADIYFIDLLSGARRRIVNAPGTNSGAAISPDGRKVALTMSYTGNTELYVTGIGGGRGKRLTRTPAVEASPTWSPDGKALIYTSNASGRPQLYRVSSRGGKGKLLGVGYGHCTEPDWSPDGSKIAFNVLTGGSQAVAVFDFATGRSRIASSGGSAENPTWGADSRHLVFARGGSLVLLDTDTGASQTLLSGMRKVSEPTWTH